MRYEIAHNRKNFEGFNIWKRKVIAFRERDVSKVGYNNIWLLYLKKCKLHEYEILGFPSMLVKISLHVNATSLSLYSSLIRLNMFCQNISLILLM